MPPQLIVLDFWQYCHRQQRAGEDAWSDDEEAQLSESDSEPGAGRDGGEAAAAERLDDEEHDGGGRLGYGERDGRYERDYDEDDEDARLVGVRQSGCQGIFRRPACQNCVTDFWAPKAPTHIWLP